MPDKNKITIAIADDHPMLLKGLYEELVANDYNVVGKGTNGMEVLEIILSKNPTIALLDIDMPFLTGFEVVKMAKEKGSNTKFILLSFHKEIDYVVQAKALQINGYLLKEDSFQDIELCIETILEGKEYFSKSFDSVSLQNAGNELRKLKFLTPSETIILKLIGEQKNTAKIAETLSVSVRTVEKHRSNIIIKLEIESGTNTLTNWALLNKNIIQNL